MGKAIAIDEWSADALTTSMVDDVFFILQKCGRRALATGNLQCLCAILGQINNLLSNSLRTALELNWKVHLQLCLCHLRTWVSLHQFQIADSCCFHPRGASTFVSTSLARALYVHQCVVLCMQLV